jgi:hypothetical protein
MKAESQKRAVANHRRRMAERGMSRYEVRGLNGDKEIVRALAQRLAMGNAAAAQLRAEVVRKIGGGSGHRGHILAALRRSPLVGADLNTERAHDRGRDIEL